MGKQWKQWQTLFSRLQNCCRWWLSSVQSPSHVQLFETAWTAAQPSFPVHHQLPELTQTHVHLVSDAIQPSHALSSPSPPAFNLSQHQDLFQWVSSSYQVAEVILKPAKIKSVTVSIVSPYICHELMGPDAMILVFWMLTFKQTFSLSSCTFIKVLFSFSSFSATRVVSFAGEVIDRWLYGDCRHEIKRCLLLGWKDMTNLDSILKSRDIT